ncbi:MAG: formate dehydrogenase accessory sulfurtransferase FdhD [Methanomicrobiales archaeon]|jgi:FdhD protein|nr:formate dehydrogenase accessory sulfurtransferase FdhD [Methanomicrobiales archaeon]MDD1645627.1 formate dehydrogenase accessory sulfurtransferase FdhD [Methanomicrobiales archaeon]
MYRELPCVKVDGASAKEGIHPVVEEVPVMILVNGRHLATAMMSPVRLEEFVVGHLFTEGIIRSRDAIESVQVEKGTIRVLTRDHLRPLGPKRTILSGCGGSASFLDPAKLPKITSDYTVDTPRIAEAMKGVLDSEIHRLTGGVHVVGLASDRGVLCVREDIGRHNAMDRAIGYGLTEEIDLARTFVVSSGRISSEMARKCLVAGIPIVVSRSATTVLAVELAEKNGLTICAFARGSRMNVYTHTHRIRITGGGPA